VEEYRNGELLSTIRRDFQYNVQPCNETVAAFFTEDIQCNDLTVYFDNQSFSNTPDYLWYFDYPDGTASSTEANPSYTYPETGTYTVMLIVNPGQSCVDTFMRDIVLTSFVLEAEPQACDGLSYMASLQIIGDSLSGGFSVTDQDGNELGVFSYDDLPVEVGPFSPDEVYVLTAQDTAFTSCSSSVEIGPVICEVACDAQASNPICPGDVLFLAENGGDAVSWLWSSDGAAVIALQ